MLYSSLKSVCVNGNTARTAFNELRYFSVQSYLDNRTVSSDLPSTISSDINFASCSLNLHYNDYYCKSVLCQPAAEVQTKSKEISVCVEVVMGLLIYLIESHQTAGLTLMDQVRITSELTGHRAIRDVTVNTSLCSILHNKI